MDSKEKFEIEINKTFGAEPGKILDLFRDNTVFKLTGADKIQNDFRIDGAFRLEFKDRGKIHGHFRKITGDELNIEWNVDGFQRPKEINTFLEIYFSKRNGGCLLSIFHKNIVNEAAAIAKKSAWTEILNGIDCIMSKRENALNLSNDK